MNGVLLLGIVSILDRSVEVFTSTLNIIIIILPTLLLLLQEYSISKSFVQWAMNKIPTDISTHDVIPSMKLITTCYNSVRDSLTSNKFCKSRYNFFLKNILLKITFFGLTIQMLGLLFWMEDEHFCKSILNYS